MFFLFFRSVWAHISFLNVQSFLNVCLYTVQSVIEHPKTTSVSQPDSKKIQGLIGVHILFVAKNSFLTYVYIQFETEFFTTKQPLISRLARKNKGGCSGSISRFGAENPFLTYVHIHFKTEFFTTKQPLIPRLARKKRLAGLNSYLASWCRSILCVFLYTVKTASRSWIWANKVCGLCLFFPERKTCCMLSFAT